MAKKITRTSQWFSQEFSQQFSSLFPQRHSPKLFNFFSLPDFHHFAQQELFSQDPLVGLLEEVRRRLQGATSVRRSNEFWGFDVGCS